MFTEREVRRQQYVERLRRRHMLFAQAFIEIKRALSLMRQQGKSFISVPFSPIHYHMDVLPGVNSHLIPAKYVGWRRLRAIDVFPDDATPGHVTISYNADYAARMGK